MRARKAPLSDQIASALSIAQRVEPDSLEARGFGGLAAVYGGEPFYSIRTSDWTLVPTVFEVGAFEASIAEINGRGGDRAGRIPALWEHWSLLGRTVSLVSEAEGVRFTARVTDEPASMARYAHIQNGACDGLSVGWKTLASRMVVHEERAGEEVEHVEEARLDEITACVWGANPDALIEAVASRDVEARNLAALERIAERLEALASFQAAPITPIDASVEFRCRLEALETLAGLRKE